MLIFGFLLGVVAIVMITKIGDFTKYPNASDIKTFPTLVIILGFLIVAAAIIGSFGLYIENLIFVTIFAGTTCMLFLLQLSMAIWGFVYTDSMRDLVLMAWSQNSYYKGFPMGTLEIQFGCCGRYGSTDYTSRSEKVPNSCCGAWILVDCPDTVYLSKPGCQDEFYNFWSHNINIIQYSGIVLLIAQLLALISAFHFIKVLRIRRSLQS